MHGRHPHRWAANWSYTLTYIAKWSFEKLILVFVKRNTIVILLAQVKQDRKYQLIASLCKIDYITHRNVHIFLLTPVYCFDYELLNCYASTFVNLDLA